MSPFENIRNHPRYLQLRRYLPAIFFLSGFIWDAIFLGTELSQKDLVVLVLYTTLSAVILLLLGREVKFRFSEYLILALQFFLGGIFNALVIFYFISSASLATLAVVAILMALLIGNEILHRKYERVTLSWTMFGVAVVMLLNFLLPNIFRSISSFWFYASSIAALALVALLRLAARQERATILPTVVAVCLLMVLHVLHLIPPVPLAQKKMLICHDLVRTTHGYRANVEQRFIPASWVFEQKVSQRGGEKIFCFTSVFVPPGITTRITHQWLHLEEQSGDWIVTTSLTFPIRSGRREGYRGYSYKRNLQPGRWKVIAKSETGQTIGEIRFRVVNEPAKTKTVRL